MTKILVTLILLSSLLANAQIDSAVIAKKWSEKHPVMLWVDGRTMISSQYYPVFLDLTTPKNFNTNTGHQYITIIAKVPDANKRYQIDLKATENTPTVPSVTEKIDGELATFSAGWTRTLTNPGWYQNSIAFSNTVGSTVSYTFTGTKVELWAERLATHGTGTISIDNGTPLSVSFKVAPYGLPVKIYESAVLPNGSHTIKLTVVSGYNLLDYFLVTK